MSDAEYARRREGVAMLREIAVCALLIIPPLVYCGESTAPPGEMLTLEAALAQALANNLEVKNAHLEVRKAGDDVAAAKTKRLPKLDFSLYGSHHFTDEGYTFKAGSFGTFDATGPIPAQDVTIKTTPTFTTLVSASASLPLSQQYRIGKYIEQFEVQQGMATEELQSQRQTTAKDVKQVYYGILETQDALVAKRETIVFLRSLDQLVDRYVQEHRVLESDSLEVKTQLAKAQQEELSERNTLASYKEKLNILLGRDVEADFQVSPVPEMQDVSVDEARAQADALAQRPVVNEAKLKVQHAEDALKIKKSEYLPDISLDVRYVSPFGTEFLPENLATVGVFARWDVFDWGKKDHELDERGAEILKAKNDVRNAQAHAVAEVNEKIRALKQAQALVPVTLLAEKTAQEQLRVTLNRYRNQSALIQDVLKAQSKLTDATSDYQKAHLGVWNAWADLQKARGEE
jgi:outer membrane protein